MFIKAGEDQFIHKRRTARHHADHRAYKHGGRPIGSLIALKRLKIYGDVRLRLPFARIGFRRGRRRPTRRFMPITIGFLFIGLGGALALPAAFGMCAG